MIDRRRLREEFWSQPIPPLLHGESRAGWNGGEETSDVHPSMTVVVRAVAPAGDLGAHHRVDLVSVERLLP
jgi:hypothetical protein